MAMPICPENCTYGCELGTSACKIPCPQGCSFGCTPGTGECATPIPAPSSTVTSEPSATPSATPTPSPSPSPSYCNGDYYCDPAAGENDQVCPVDCVPTSYCKYPTSGIVTYDFMCKRYRLATQGLYLEVYYNGAEGEAIRITGFRCTTNESLGTGRTDVTLAPGGSAVIANGTVPCYAADGTIFSAGAGEEFDGKLLFDYTKGDSPTLFHATLSFRTRVRGIS